MNPLIQLKKATPLFLIILGSLWLGPLPKAQAVSPAPDGGYPGGNTAEGQTALLSLTTGGFNTAVGFLSLRSNTTGSFNTGVGAGTLLANTADQNTATGFGALLSNTLGASNTANGAFALFSNTTGGANTAIGIIALENNTSGESNTAIGGGGALLSNTTGGANTAIGGGGALFSNTTGSFNTGLGFGAGSNVTTADHVICIGANVAGFNVSNSCFIGNISGAPVGASAVPVLVDSTGKLGTMISSRRFKKEIQPMDKASEAILRLKPVTFQYKSDKTKTPQFGLIAEQVAEVNPDLVVRDENGAIYTVRYDAVNAMLLNEFLKEHKTVQEQADTISIVKANSARQEATIARLEQQIDALTAGLQKVSAQLEVSNSSQRTVLNDP